MVRSQKEAIFVRAKKPNCQHLLIGEKNMKKLGFLLLVVMLFNLIAVKHP